MAKKKSRKGARRSTSSRPRRGKGGTRRGGRTDVRVQTFLEASSHGDVERILFLLREGVDPESADPEGRTGLYVAARAGRASAVRVLIEARADCNLRVEHDPELSRLRPWSVPRGPKELTASVRLDRGVVAAVVSPITPITRAQRRADDAAGFDVTPLMAASINGHSEVVQALVNAGADVNTPGWKGRTALILAVIFRHPTVVKALIAGGADVNVKDDEGVSGLIAATENEDQEVASALAKAGAREPNLKSIALVAAVESGDLERLGFVMSTGVDVNEVDVFGATALTRAAMFGHFKIADRLLAHGAEVNLPDRAGFTPLIAAAYYGKIPVVHLLVHAGADLNAVHLGSTALDYAKSFGHSEIARFLARVGASRKETLHDAVIACSVEKVRELIQRKSPLDEVGDDGETPLALAARSGDLTIVRLLLQAGARPDFRGASSPLENAALNGQIKVVEALIDAGADPNSASQDGVTPLMLAAEAGHLDVVEELIESGADPSARARGGKTAIGLASTNSYNEIVEYLAPLVTSGQRRRIAKEPKLAEGAKKEVRKAAAGDGNATDLILHSAQGNLEGVRACLESGADVEAADEQGETALHKAAWWGHTEVAQTLIDAGAKVDARGTDGWTPLMGAARMGHPDVIRLLSHAGADPNAQDRNGATASRIAASLGQRAAVEALVDAGAMDAPQQMVEVEKVERRLDEELTGFADFIHEKLGDSGLAGAIKSLADRSSPAGDSRGK